MRVAVIYSSRTGNTRMLAEAIHKVMPHGADIFPVAHAPKLARPNSLSAPSSLSDPIDLGGPADPTQPAPPATLNSYDFVALGFWVDKGQPDSAMKAYMTQMQGQRVGLFGTLGAYPDSDHARESMAAAQAMMTGNTVLGSFICQGKVDPAILDMMAKMRAAQVAHPMTDERAARIEEAKKHPNADDCANAQQAFVTMLDALQS